MTFLMTQVLVTKSYRIENIISSSGLFYKHLGVAKTSNQKYSLLIYYNLTLLDDQLDLINSQYTKAITLCHLMDDENYSVFYCQNQIKNLNNIITQIKNKLSILENHTRQKRGVINGISTGLKWLFGTSDADDAIFYSDSINSLINDQKQTHTLMQH